MKKDLNNQGIIISGGSIESDNIAVGHNASIISHDYLNQQTDELQNFLSNLRSQIDKLGLKENEYSEANADIACVEAQLLSAKPKKSIIKESLISIRNIIEGTTGSIIANGLLDQIKAFI